MTARFLITTDDMGIFLGTMSNEPVFSRNNFANRTGAATFPTREEAEKAKRKWTERVQKEVGRVSIMPVEPNDGYYVTKARCIKLGLDWESPELAVQVMREDKPSPPVPPTPESPAKSLPAASPAPEWRDVGDGYSVVKGSDQDPAAEPTTPARCPHCVRDLHHDGPCLPPAPGAVARFNHRTSSEEASDALPTVPALKPVEIAAGGTMATFEGTRKALRATMRASLYPVSLTVPDTGRNVFMWRDSSWQVMRYLTGGNNRGVWCSGAVIGVEVDKDAVWMELPQAPPVDCRHCKGTGHHNAIFGPPGHPSCAQCLGLGWELPQ